MLYITLKKIPKNKLYPFENLEQLKTFIDFEANGFTETAPIPLSSILKSSGLGRTYWFLSLTEQGRQLLKVYILWNSEKVLPIWEKYYPNDNRPRLAIEAARKAFENPTEENKKAAYAAAYASDDASDAAAAYASDAADAAALAAYAAADANASVADVRTANVADAAALAATYNEAYTAFKKEQEAELLRLIEEVN